MFYYVYRITNKILNKHYYGFRSCKTHPKEDLGVKYISSTDKSFICDQKENPQNYKYKVVKIFNNKVDDINLEVKLHGQLNVAINESFYNLAKQTSTKFTTAGISIKMQRSKEYNLNTAGLNVKFVGSYITDYIVVLANVLINILSMKIMNFLNHYQIQDRITLKII